MVAAMWFTPLLLFPDNLKMEIRVKNIIWFSWLIAGAMVSLTLALSGQTYTDISSIQGISPSYNSGDNWGSGVSFYDINNDGWDDLTYTRESDSIYVYFNHEGDFEKTALNIPVQQRIKQALWVDFDNDGDNDLMVSNYFGKLHLYQNDGYFNFIDVTEQAGLPFGTGYYYGVSFADYNRDGFLDLFVAIYHFMPDDFIHKNELYKNNGDGTFSNVTIEAGLAEIETTTFQGGWFDYNNDGWPDLYEINDKANFDNLLYHNNGDGTFTCVSQTTNTHFPGNNPMTFTAGDFDNDGHFDLYITNTGGNVQHTELLVNDGNGLFQEAAQDLGVYSELFSWGALWVDHNNDGRQDLYVATSPIHPLATVHEDLFFVQNEAGQFELDSTVFPEMEVHRNYAVARGDVNNDGYPDIATHSIAPFPSKLWLNSGGDQHYLKITPRGTVSNRMAIGTWIRVYVADQQLTHYTMCGENYVSQNSQHLIFGLGDADIVDSVHVEYLSGHTDQYYNLPSNQHYYVTEGDTYQVQVNVETTSVCEGDSVVLDAGEHVNYLWNTGQDERYLTVSESGSYALTVWNGFGIPAYSDTIEIQVYPNPVVQAETQQPLCSGDNTGMIQLENLMGVSIAEVNWNDSLQGAMIDSLYAGDYSYHLTDVHGCSDSGLVFLNEPLLLSALIFTFPETQGDDGTILLVINGGVAPYEIYLNGELQNTPEIEGLSAGTYVVSVIDAHLCAVTEEVEIQTVTNVLQHEEAEITVYPNPLAANEYFTLLNLPTFCDCFVIISDVSGKTIWSQPLNQHHPDRLELKMPSVDPGTYFLRIISNDKTIKTTVILVSR